MTDYETNATVEDIAGALRQAEHIVLTTHAKPDGDALGSVLALSRGLAEIGQQADIWLMGPLDPTLEAMIGDTPHVLVDREIPDGDPDFIVVCDTGAIAQLRPLAEWLAGRRDRVVVLDHHVNGDDIAARRIVDASCACAAQIAARVLDSLGCSLSGGAYGVAEALLMAVTTDTGWFRFQNADAEALRFAARMMDAGADKTRLYRLLEERYRRERLDVTRVALESLEYLQDGFVAVMSLGPDVLAKSGGASEDMSGIVNLPMTVREVGVSILLTAFDDTETKVSLRSKPGVNSCNGMSRVVDVNALASTFGGGGHVHAAGARLSMNLAQSKACVAAAVESYFKTLAAAV